MQLEEVLDDLYRLSEITNDDPRLENIAEQLRVVANQLCDKGKRDPRVIAHYTKLKKLTNDMEIWFNER